MQIAATAVLQQPVPDSVAREVVTQGVGQLLRHDLVAATAAVWVVVAPALALFMMGLAVYLLNRLKVSQATTVVHAQLAAAEAAHAVVVAQHSAAVIQASAVSQQEVAQAQVEHMATQDVALEQIHTAVNSQKTELEHVNDRLRDALAAAGIRPPPGTER